MIKVGFIIPDTGHQNRGVGVYAKNLLKELKKQTEVEILESTDPNLIKDADLIHFPFFDLFYPTLPLRKKYPAVVTIHDVTPLLFPKAYPPGLKGKINFQHQKISLKSTKAVITDSLASKNDIQKFLNISSSKIFPIHLAPSQEYKKVLDNEKLSKIKKKYNLPENFAIFIGNVNFNKNIIRVTEACLEAGLDLVLIGKSFSSKNNLNHPELKSFKEFLERFSQNPKVHILGFVETNETVLITNLASTLLLPSIYEGFGMTILEAQISGVPVITGNVSSMPEVAGTGAILVDPNNANEITEAIKKVLTDENLKEELIKKGFENIKRFSWEKCARQTLEVYKKVIAHEI